MINEILFKDLYSWLYAGIVACVVVIIITTGQTNTSALYAFRGSYTGLLVAFTIICALLGMAKSVEFDSLYSNLGLINRIIKYVFLFFPFLTVMAVLMWTLVLLHKYFDKISENKVSDYYTSFINTISILLFAQIYVLTSGISETSFKNFQLSKKTASMLRLFGLLNIISVFTLQIILKYYTTDC
jgi:hypothetical protein